MSSKLISSNGKECESLECINILKNYENRKCYDCLFEEENFIPLKKQKKSHEPDIKCKYDKTSNLFIYDVENLKNIKEPKPKMFSIGFLQKFYNMKV
jgi:hypothetical protein